jgi:hypothetical protein
MFSFIKKRFQSAPAAEQPPVPTIGNVMQAYAGDAVAHAREFGFALDYSEASLDQVDSVLSKLTASGVLLAKSPTEEESLWLLSKKYGGDLGQVVIREIGGGWEMQDLPSGGARVVLRSQGVQMFPLEKIFKRLTEDQYSGVSGYCRALRLIIGSERKNA